MATGSVVSLTAFTCFCVVHPKVSARAKMNNNFFIVSVFVKCSKLRTKVNQKRPFSGRLCNSLLAGTD